MSKHKCCVPLCSTTIKDGIPLHSFPNPDKDSERFRLWVLKIGGDIIGLDNKAIFKYRRVCHKHFASNFLYLSNHISKTAVPQLLLPAPHRLNTITNLVHLSTSPVEQELANVDIEPVPSTSQMSVKTSVPEKRHLSGQSKVSQIEQTNVRQIMKQITTVVKRRTRMGSVQLAKRISKMKAFNILTTEMSENAKKFFFMQVTQSKKKMKGRRFTLDEKILALSLYKPSPKAYRMLQKFCVLPSRRCLQSLLQTVSLRPGCNDRIFSHLKKRVAKMPEKHRYCTLVFDEMAIARSCSFNTGKDIIEGFVNDGENTESTFCDHVLVFMIRGVVKKYKQPVWYSFSSGTTKTLTLKNQIKAVIKQLLLIKLKVIATVCDQGATNIAAINSLISDTKAHYLRNKQEYTGTFFETENKKIFVLYDPPHIMKGIRNNLLNKNLKFTMDGKEKTAKWEHINALYERSPGYKGAKIVPKLTAHHIVPHLIPKMKVKHCTQVFSKSVGAALGFMAESGCLPKESTETADLLIFFDELFDSVNGNFHQVVGGKIYRTAVTPKSPHHKLWRKSLPVLKSMKFDTLLKRGVVPSITSWVKTIESFENICIFLQKKGINSLLLRNFNQDALENFFGSIRAHGHGNIMPNASHFEAAYKTLLFNNLTSHHAVGSNCEADDGFALDSCKEFLDETPKEEENAILIIEMDHVAIMTVDTESLITDKQKYNVEKCAAIGYCSGWIVVKAKKAIYKNCLQCTNSMETQTIQSFHKYIKVKEFENKRWLCYPTRCMFDFFAQVENITYEILKTNAIRNNISEYIKLIVNINISLNFIDCAEHSEALKKFIINKSVIFFIHNWCKEISHLLTGKVTYYDENDPFKTSARSIFLKSNTRKKYRQTGESSLIE